MNVATISQSRISLLIRTALVIMFTVFIVQSFNNTILHNEQKLVSVFNYRQDSNNNISIFQKELLVPYSYLSKLGFARIANDGGFNLFIIIS